MLGIIFVYLQKTKLKTMNILRQYGHIDDSIAKAARVASELCNKEITTEDFYKCMIALKVSRMAYNTKKDTMLDCVGYIAALDNFKNNGYE